MVGLSVGDTMSGGREKNQRCSFVGLWPSVDGNWKNLKLSKD